MAVATTVKADGGEWDLVLELMTSSKSMGFKTVTPPDEQSINNLAPTLRIGSDPRYQEGTYERWVLDGTHSGGDKLLYESGDTRYKWSDGNVMLYRDDVITLASQWASTDASKTATARQIVDFPVGNEYVCVGVGTVVRLYNVTTASWGDSSQTFGANAIHLFANDQYLFVSCGTGDNFWRWDGTTWSQPSATDAHCMTWFKEVLYRGLSNTVIPSTTNHDGANWGTAVNVGWKSTNVEDLFVAQGYLWAAKPEGLYASSDGSAWTLIVDTEETRTTGNWVGSREWEGGLYGLHMNDVSRINLSGVNSATVTRVNTDMKGDTNKERYGHGFPKMVAAGPKKVFIAFDDEEGLYPSVLAYNGIGTFQVYRGASGDTMRAMGYSRLMGYLLINDGATRRKRITNLTDGEYPDYASSGQFELSTFDAGLPQVMKSWRGISFELKDCDSDNTVKVEYSADEGAWTEIETFISSGVVEAFYSESDVQIGAYKMDHRITLTRDSGDVTKTPKIKNPMTFEVRPQPNAIHAYVDYIKVAVDDPLLTAGTASELTVGDVNTLDNMLNFLDELEDSVETVRRTDEWGRRRRVKITSLSRQNPQRFGYATPRETPIFQLTSYDLFTGIIREVDHSVTASITVASALADAGAYYGQDTYGFATYGDGT